MYKKRFCLLFAVITCTVINAQQTISSAGMTINSPKGNMSLSIGQVAYITTGNNLTLSQGVLQIFNRRSTNYPFNFDNPAIITIWPNPVAINLYIKIEGVPISEIIYQIWDVNGHLMLGDKIYTSTSFINMQKLAAGIYLLKINFLKKKSFAFKIVKL